MTWSTTLSLIKAVRLGLRPLPPLRCCKHEPRCATYPEHKRVLEAERMPAPMSSKGAKGEAT